MTFGDAVALFHIFLATTMRGRYKAHFLKYWFSGEKKTQIEIVIYIIYKLLIMQLRDPRNTNYSHHFNTVLHFKILNPTQHLVLYYLHYFQIRLSVYWYLFVGVFFQRLTVHVWSDWTERNLSFSADPQFIDSVDGDRFTGARSYPHYAVSEKLQICYLCNLNFRH